MQGHQRQVHFLARVWTWIEAMLLNYLERPTTAPEDSGSQFSGAKYGPLVRCVGTSGMPNQDPKAKAKGKCHGSRKHHRSDA